MMNLNPYQIFGILAGIASVIAFAHYIFWILRRGTRPSQAAWWSWALIALVYTASSWAAGASWQVLILPAWLCFSQLAVAVISLKYGDKTWDRLNIWCVVGAIVAGFGISIWHVTNEPLAAFLIAIIADCLASVPNFRHAWKDPEQEDRLGWVLGWISAILAVFAIEQRNLANAGFGIYFFITMTVVVAFVWRPTIKQWWLRTQDA